MCRLTHFCGSCRKVTRVNVKFTAGLATPSSPFAPSQPSHPDCTAGFTPTEPYWIGHVHGPGCQSPGDCTCSRPYVPCSFECISFRDWWEHAWGIDTRDPVSPAGSLTGSPARLPALLHPTQALLWTQASSHHHHHHHWHNWSKCCRVAAGAVSPSSLCSALLSHTVGPDKRSILTSLGEVTTEEEKFAFQIVRPIWANRALFACQGQIQQLIFILFCFCWFIFFLP